MLLAQFILKKAAPWALLELNPTPTQTNNIMALITRIVK